MADVDVVDEICESYDELNDELSRSLNLSIEEIGADIDSCTKKLICNVVEEIQKGRKRANKDNIFKQVKHFDISYADFSRSFSDLIKEDVLKVRYLTLFNLGGGHFCPRVF